MPDFASHHLFAQKSYTSLSAVNRRVVDEFPLAYYWGAQGPDPFFYHRSMFSGQIMLRYGRMLHRHRTSSLFDWLAGYVYRQRDTEDYRLLQSYLMGFACHYALDRTIHPYVHYWVKQQRAARPEASASTLHAELESDVDCELFFHAYKYPCTHWKPEELYKPTDELKTPLTAMYFNLLFDVYKQVASPQELEALWGDCRAAICLLYAPNMLLRGAGAIVDLISLSPDFVGAHIKRERAGWDALNLRHRPWYNLAEEKSVSRTSSILDLMDEAAALTKKLTPKLMTTARKGTALPRDLFNLPFV